MVFDFSRMKHCVFLVEIPTEKIILIFLKSFSHLRVALI